MWTSDTTLQQGQSQPHTDFHIRDEALESSKILDVSRIWKNQKVSGTVGTFAKGKCTTVANRTCNTCTSNRTDTTSFENPTQYYTHWRRKKQQQNVSTWFQHRFERSQQPKRAMAFDQSPPRDRCALLTSSSSRFFLMLLLMAR